jgi:hypothetical protein
MTDEQRFAEMAVFVPARRVGVRYRLIKLFRVFFLRKVLSQ